MANRSTRVTDYLGFVAEELPGVEGSKDPGGYTGVIATEHFHLLPLCLLVYYGFSTPLYHIP